MRGVDEPSRSCLTSWPALLLTAVGALEPLDVALSASPHGDEEARPARQVQSATPSDTLRGRVSQGDIDEVWLSAAERLLDRMEKREAERFRDSLSEPQRTAFAHVVRARFVSTPERLRELTQGGGPGGVEEAAARRELKRRLTEDGNVALISRMLGFRPDVAADIEDTLRKGIDKEDEAKVAAHIARLLQLLTPSQRRKALEEARRERGKTAVVLDPKRVRQVDRWLWALEQILGESRTGSELAGRFRDEVAKADRDAKAVTAGFRDLVGKAAAGDRSARDKLVEQYDPKLLLDLVAGQHEGEGAESALELAKALSWRDINGVYHLDVKRSGDGDGSEPGGQTWTLGKTAEEMRKALAAFDVPGGHDGGSATPTARSRLQRFEPSLEPPASGKRNFFHVADGARKPYDPPLLQPEDSAVCRIDDPTSSKPVQLSESAGWFFRPFPEGGYGSYAGAKDHGVASPNSPNQNTNRIVDLATGKEIPMPGPYDPVPTPDEKYMTVPLDKGLTFYDMTSLMSGKPVELFTDEKMGGVYQSIGIVGNPEMGTTTYRVITDLKGLSYRDYEISRGPGGSSVVRPQGDGPKRLCEGLDLALPMLSKDGQMLAALDLKTRTTKIFKLEGDRCQEKIDLGMFTSKVDFSFDKRFITFHRINNEKLFDPSRPYTRVPSDDHVSNVYVYDLDTGALVRMTNNTDSNAVYPAFRRDGKITYIQHPSRGEGDPKPSQLITADPRKGKEISFDHFLPKSAVRPDQEEKLKAAVALGSLWSRLCSPFGKDISTESAVLATFNLDPKACVALVDRYWDKLKRTIGESSALDRGSVKAASVGALAKADVTKACPSAPATVTPPPPPDAPRPPTPPPPTGAAAVPASCRHCHRRESAFPIPWDDPAAMRAMRTTSRNSRSANMADEIMARVRSTDRTYRMPPPGEDTAMTPAQILTLEKYLQR